jgi:hypothetical protein
MQTKESKGKQSWKHTLAHSEHVSEINTNKSELVDLVTFELCGDLFMFRFMLRFVYVPIELSSGDAGKARAQVGH